MHSLRGSLVNTREKHSLRIDARIYSYTQVLSHSLAFEVPVSSIPSAGTEDSIVGGHQGSGKEAGIPKRREERSRSGFGGRRPLKKSTVQVALRGRLQTCFTCLGPLGLYEYRSIVWPVMPMIMVFGALFFKECLGASRAEPAVFNHNDDLSSFAAP